MRWDIFAAIVAVIAIFFTASPLVVNFIQDVFKAAVRKSITHLSQCEKLEWSDVPDGLLHDCKPFAAFCNNKYHAQVPIASYGRQPQVVPPHDLTQCWPNLVSMVLSRAWNAANRRSITVKKPDCLAIRERYLCTDVETLNVIRLFMPSDKLDISTIGGYLVVHLRPQYLLHYPGLTKVEASRIVSGFLPWYRETLTTADGIILPHPIRELADTSRGGWIVGVGLSLQQPLQSYRLETGVTIKRNSHVELLGATSTVEKAFKRIRYALEKLETVFPGDHSVEQASKLFLSRESHPIFPLSLAVGWTVSGIEHAVIQSGLFAEYLGDDTRTAYALFTQFLEPREWARNLTKEQCSLAIETFNTLMPIPSEDVDMIRPILRQTVQAAIYGLYVVCRYCGERVRDLPEFEGRTRVFLRNCSNGESQ